MKSESKKGKDLPNGAFSLIIRNTSSPMLNSLYGMISFSLNYRVEHV